MDKYLIDVPVQINIWIRQECQKQQWEVIKQAKPRVLFIISDGGRTESEWEAIYANRKMIDESIDWECEVFRLYEDHNNGLYTMSRKVNNFIWSKVDRCIFTEDDQVMSLSFFRYCAELLDKYKDDQRIECICGYNPLGIWEEASSDYFFSKQGSIWGFATWRDRFLDFSFEYGQDPYTMKLLKEQTSTNKRIWRRIKAYAENEFYEGHIATEEFWIDFNMFGQNRVQIIPKYNLISNVGVGKNSEHAKVKLTRHESMLFNSKTYELNFPLNHPKYVIPDNGYYMKRNKALNQNQPFYRVKFVLYCLITFNYKVLIERMLSKIRKKREK